MQDSSTQRKQWLDAIKGVAIILVVMSHTQAIPYIHQYLTACYMPLFFIASGYVFKDKTGTYRRKCKQLLVPYTSWAIFYLLLSCVIYHNIELAKIGKQITGIIYSRFYLYDSSSAINIKLFPAGAGPLWFLTCMATSYVLLKPLIRVKKRILLILFYMAISAGFMFCPILMPWSLDTAFMGALFIYTGYRLKDVHVNSKQIHYIFLISALIYLVLTRINGGINMSIRVYGNLGMISLILFGIIGILGTISYATFFMKLNDTWLCRFFAYFGKMSLTIMCAHMLYATLFNQGICLISAQGFTFPQPVLYIVRLSCVLLLCIITHSTLNYLKTKYSSPQKNKRM